LGIRDQYCEGADEARENPEAKPAPERSDLTDDREIGASGGGQKEKLRNGKKLRGTARASDSSASGCRAPARESSAFHNASRNGREELMSAQGTRGSEKRAKAQKVAKEKQVLEAVS
jgi:hypothetical protein